ncbi:prepilin peptidase [Parasporobacterium paucivorans]|uniref:Leader peptidase (Prepilin peptidase) / N-methyltransferase n=1 Tax=Parasporobacterium paucivorans DSM 15970 TaxID=1122934 RepID=A0A1M6JAB6_9FIRM|nr:prepilin peptidase [Parasporobacterium paucivorans]SHJ43590.1 leader peptidase (prepilin peptidase) / N-methyltransferase [Parasporobacterium paucivorans DSM 15970]
MAYKIIPIIFLGIHSITDIRYKKVSLMLCVISALAGLLLNILLRESDVSSRLLALLPGAGMILLGRFSRDAVGLGDGIVIMVLGLYMGVAATLAILMAGLFIAALVSLALIVFKKAGGKDRIAFVPCLFAGYLITITLGGMP